MNIFFGIPSGSLIDEDLISSLGTKCCHWQTWPDPLWGLQPMPNKSPRWISKGHFSNDPGEWPRTHASSCPGPHRGMLIPRDVYIIYRKFDKSHIRATIPLVKHGRSFKQFFDSATFNLDTVWFPRNWKRRAHAKWTVYIASEYFISRWPTIEWH